MEELNEYHCCNMEVSVNVIDGFLYTLLQRVDEFDWKMTDGPSGSLTEYTAIIDKHGTELRLVYTYSKMRHLYSETIEKCSLCVCIPRRNEEHNLQSERYPIIMQIYHAVDEIVKEQQKRKEDNIDFWEVAYDEVFRPKI